MWEKDINLFFEDILNKVKIQKEAVINQFSNEFETLISNHKSKLEKLEDSLWWIETSNSIKNSLKAYSEVEFLKWYTNKQNPVDKML